MSKKLFAKYYQENKEKLKKKAPKKYKNPTKKKNKEKKKKYGCESYKNLPENEKNTLVEYRKKK